MAPSVPVCPQSKASRLQSNSEAGHTAYCVTRRTKGLLHLGTCLPVLLALQSLPPHSHSIGRLYTLGSPSPARPHRPHAAHSDVSRLHILPHCSRPLHLLARSRPHPGHPANNVAYALLTSWISSFGCPQTITTDLRHQIKSQLLQSLPRPCGIPLLWTTAHHTAANGLMECFHWTLKAATMCHTNQQCTEVLPLVLGIHTALTEDLQVSVAKLSPQESLASY
jgi:hypothetical protein